MVLKVEKFDLYTLWFLLIISYTFAGKRSLATLVFAQPDLGENANVLKVLTLLLLSQTFIGGNA